MAPIADEERARRYHRLRLGVGLVGFVLGVGYLVALLATGASVRLAVAVAAWTSHPWLQLAIVLGALAAAWRMLTLPLTWLGAFWLPRRFGLLHQSFARWAWDAVKAAAIGGALALAGAELAYALLRLTPWWWLLSALAFFAAAVLLTLVAPVWLLPLFYRLTPLEGPLRARLVGLAARAGVPVLGVWVGDQSRKSRTANAAVTGLGRTRRIILFDTLLNEFTEDEVEAVLAHELAHHAHADMWRGLAVHGAVTLATFWLADRALTAGAARLGLTGPADLAGLPLVGLIVVAAGLAALPLTNGWSRHVERQADDFAVRALGRAEAFVAAMERLARLNLAERDPHPLKEALFYSHPAIGRRIARARSLAVRSAG